MKTEITANTPTIIIAYDKFVSIGGGIVGVGLGVRMGEVVRGFAVGEGVDVVVGVGDDELCDGVI